MRWEGWRGATMLAILVLAGCGGGGSGGAGGMGGSTAGVPARGSLLQTPPQLLSTLTASSLLTELNVASNLLLLTVSGTPVCDVLMYHIEYETVDGAGEPTGECAGGDPKGLVQAERGMAAARLKVSQKELLMREADKPANLSRADGPILQ